MAEYIDIVLFCRKEDSAQENFVEIENNFGRSISIGEFRPDTDGYRRIRIRPEDIQKA